MHAISPRSAHERGVSLVVVLIFLTVMLLGSLALARLSSTGILIAGNAALKDGALQASEVGVNAAFADVQALVDDGTSPGSWYYTSAQALTAEGVPSAVDWAKTAKSALLPTSSPYQVRYVVERLCSVDNVTDAPRQCMVKPIDVIHSYRPGPSLDPPFARLYRITVRTTESTGTATVVQALVTR